MELGDSTTAEHDQRSVVDKALDTFDAALTDLISSAETGGLDRLDWSVPEGTDAVIVELGANDMLRGIDPKVTRQALDAIVRRLAERRVVVLLAGMRAAANLGSDYRRDFDTIYSELAVRHDLLFYPFFLEGVAGEAGLNQGDGLHPNAMGVDAIVARILPKLEELIRRVRDRRVM